MLELNRPKYDPCVFIGTSKPTGAIKNANPSPCGPDEKRTILRFLYSENTRKWVHMMFIYFKIDNYALNVGLEPKVDIRVLVVIQYSKKIINMSTSGNKRHIPKTSRGTIQKLLTNDVHRNY